MSSQLTTQYPTDTLPLRVGAPAIAEQPVVLLAFAKLVILVSVMAVFTPLWLDQLGNFATATGPATWSALRFGGFGGFAALLVLAALVLKVWTGLLKYLARRD